MALCSSPRSSNQVLEAMKWYFGKRHCRTITFTATSETDVFELNVITSLYVEKKYLVFLDDGVATAPTPDADQTLVTVDVSAAVTAEAVATAFAAQLVTDTVEVNIERTGAVVEVQNKFLGAITLEDYTSATNTTQEVGALGFGGYIGQVGESELTTTTEVVQIVDDAQGTVVQDEIITGYTAEISIPLREMTTARWKQLVGEVTGNNVTIDTKEITGYGTEKLYKSLFDFAGRLVGHPVRLADSNIDEDIIMLKTAPKLESINFSGGAIQEGSFLFTAYKDANADAKINLLARGDHSKF